jgi:hypothetical protein
LKTPQNDKFFFEDSKTSKYENNFFSKFTRRKAITPWPPLQNFTQMFLKTHKMTRRKLKTLKLQNNKLKLSKSTRAKPLPHPPLAKLHTMFF